MSRIAALFAIIAFVVMTTGMASARAMPMVGSGPMAGMGPMSAMPTTAHMAHQDSAPQSPCSDAAGAMCDICCAVAPAAALIMRDAAPVRPGFVMARLVVQTGLAVPPALPPPRSADAR